MAVFYTEFAIDSQSAHDENTYHQSLTKNIEGIVPIEMRPSNFSIKFSYLPKSKRNLYVFSWKTINIPEIPEDIAVRYPDKMEQLYQANIRLMHRALKKNKWLTKHNISDIATST